MSRSIAEIQQPLLAHESPIIERTSRKNYDAFHRLRPSVAKSGLCGTGIDPYAVKLAYEGSEANESSDAMDRGTLAHLMILEPHRVDSEVAIWHGSRRAGKDWQQFEAANEGKLIMRAVDFEEVQTGAMIASNTPDVRDILAGCEVEMACLWSEGSIECKGLVDAIGKTAAHGTVCIADIKTTKRIDNRSIERTIVDLKYRESMAMYRRCVAMVRGVRPDAVRVPLIFVRLEPPYGCHIYDLTSDGLDYAEKRMLKVYEAVERCIDSGIWNPMVLRSQFGLTSYEEYEMGILDMGDDGDE